MHVKHEAVEKIFIVVHALQFSGLSIFINKYLIAITLDENIFIDVLRFPMKNIKYRDLEAPPMGGATSKPASDVSFSAWRDVSRLSP